MSVTAITDYLSIAAWPSAENITIMRQLGVRLVISMTNREPPPVLAEPPFQLLYLPANDSPFRPIPMTIYALGWPRRCRSSPTAARWRFTVVAAATAAWPWPALF